MLRGHHGELSSAGFSTDGRLLTTSGVDGTVRIWDVESGRGLLALRGHGSPVAQAGFGPQGLVLSAGYDGTVRVWNCGTCGPKEEVLELARQRAVRELTDEERAAYLPGSRSAGIATGRTFLLGALLVLGGAGVVAFAVRRWRRTGARRRAVSGNTRAPANSSPSSSSPS